MVATNTIKDPDYPVEVDHNESSVWKQDPAIWKVIHDKAWGIWEALNDNVEKGSEIPESLADYRKMWEEQIEGIDEDKKKAIIEVVNKIPVKVETDRDGSRLIEFEIWGKTRKILDPRLKNHTDNEYAYTDDYNPDIVYVGLWWMRDESSMFNYGWKNLKLCEYINKKSREGFEMATERKIKEILSLLWEKAKLDEEKDQIAMLMYLTWMDWKYWLLDYLQEEDVYQWEEDYSWDSIEDPLWNSRLELSCDIYNRGFRYYDKDDHSASLCMIACN